MSDYKSAKAGRLKLKGKKLPSAKKRSGEAGGGDGGGAAAAAEAGPSKRARAGGDAEEHGGWWTVQEEAQLCGGEQMAIELAPNAYLAAMDNGKFTLGPLHSKGEPPHPEEIFHLIKTSDTKWLALRTGFGKYIGVDSSGKVVGQAEAIGGREKWEAVFHEGKTALQALGNSCFLSSATDAAGLVYASTKTAKETEMLKLRMIAERNVVADWRPSEDHMSALNCEVAYRKMYQHSKIDLNPKSRSQIREAKEAGNLHETLLDRRVKMKSDKYC